VLDRRLAKDVSAFLFPTELTSTTAVVATARPGVASAELERAIEEHLAAAAAGTLRDEEFERARNQVLNSAYAHVETAERKAEQLSPFATYFDDPGFLVREIRAYAETPPESVRRFAQEYWANDRRATLTVLPEGLPT